MGDTWKQQRAHSVHTESRCRKFDGESDSVKLMAQEAQEAWVSDSNVPSAACDAIQRHHDTV